MDTQPAPSTYKFHQQRLLGRITVQESLDRPLSDAVKAAYTAAPRHLFISRYKEGRDVWHDVTQDNIDAHLSTLYANEAMPIFEDKVAGLISTISQPGLVLKMLAMLQLQPGHRVFELGAGSGWNAAMMGHIVSAKGLVNSVEIIPSLVEPAQRVIASLGLDNVRVLLGDGGEGLSKDAPYDRAVFTAGSYDLPKAFFDQVADGGLLLIVIKNRGGGDCLYLLRKEGGHFAAIESYPVGFVPVTGKYARRDLDATLLESLPNWAALSKDVRKKVPFWWGGKGKDYFMWRTMAIRSYLAVVEPRFQVFKAEKKDIDLPGFDDGNFGIWDPESESLALARSDEMIAYGSTKALDDLVAHLHRWTDLGMPSSICLNLRAYPSTQKVQPGASEWIVRRGDADFVYSLPVKVGSKDRSS